MGVPTTTAIRPGALLDRYRLERLVAAGGMASVFYATDTLTGRAVAIKIPHAANAGDRLAVDRLRREADIGRKLDHPGLATTLADSVSHPYVVMEWIDGQLLRTVLDRQGKLPVERAVRITLAICDALEYLHTRQIVHHDLKPDNVMVCADDGVKLLDFGIAGETGTNLWRRGRQGTVAGTPDYAAPERIKGRRGDARSDIYSLGTMLYEMLTGEVPFSGLDPFTAMNLRLRIDPPSCREINPAISAELERIVHTAIARDRAKRCASASELGSDLTMILAEETVGQPVESFAGF
jgi:eukaryotic-like serine/threonine-protein kinase